MSSSKKISMVWFTYGPDAATCLRSFAAMCEHFPDSPKFIIYDAGNKDVPFSEHALNWLERHGAQVIPSAFPRRGNLRGWDCARTLANIYQYIARVTDCDFVMKVDSDFLLLDRQWIDEGLESGKPVIGPSSASGKGVTGPCYLIHKDAIPHLVESYKHDFAPYPYYTEEDYEMCCRLGRKLGLDCFHIELRSFSGIDPANSGRLVDYVRTCHGPLYWQQMIKLYQGIIFTDTLIPPPQPSEPGKQLTDEEKRVFLTEASRIRANIMRSLVKLKKYMDYNLDYQWQPIPRNA